MIPANFVSHIRLFYRPIRAGIDRLARRDNAGRTAIGALTRSKGLWCLIDQAIVSATGFLTSVLLGRMLSVDGLGVFFLAWNLVLIARAVQGDLITSPYMVYCRRKAEDAAPYYGGSVAGHQFILTAALSAALAIGTAVPAWAGAAESRVAVGFVVAATMPFLLVREFTRHYSYAHLRIAPVVLTDILVLVLQLGGLVLLSFLASMTVFRAYLVIGGASALASWAWWRLARPNWKWNAARAIEDWRTNWRFGRWALASQIAGRATVWIAPWLLALWHGERATGIFAACATLVNLAGMFVTGVGNYLTPRAVAALAESGTRELVRILRRVAVLYGIVLGGFVVAMIVFGDVLVSAVYGPTYAGNGTVIGVLAVGMLITSFGIVVGNGLWALDRPRPNFAADIASLAGSACLLPWAVSERGVAGVAWSLLAGTVLGTAVRAWAFRQAISDRIAAEETA